ncbi:MAG: hypothetical protein JG765_1592 [Cereibacter sp.]|jgi:phosphoserine phosphatase|nr:hypothetical protein [Cereibacter sp.]
MAGDLPEHYFRIRDNGAAVFRLDPGTRRRRLEMEQIATVNIRNGEIKPQGDRALTPEDLASIRGWIAERAALLARRELDEIRRVVEQLNLAAQWAQTKAEPAQLEEVTDRLLLAMHDLRTVLVRKAAERLGPDAG